MVPPKPSGVISEGSNTRKIGVKVRMEGHVQILGFPTHLPPIIFWLFGLVWEKPLGKKNREEVDSLLHPIGSSSLLAPKSGLAQKRPYVEARRGVI